VVWSVGRHLDGVSGVGREAAVMKFGKVLRKLREEKNISIAKFARSVGISPTYLAPIERDVFPPPAESKVVRIARALDQNPDEFLALAGRIGSDLRRIIYRQPRQAAELLRAIDGLPREAIDELVEAARRKSRRSSARRLRQA
jgi:transcriptional regulator with XRE-family HTH domain